MKLPSDAVAQRAYLKENWIRILLREARPPRQVDLELFFDGALTSSMTLHRAAGAAISLRTAFAEYVPLSLVYQFAYRFDDRLPPLHQVVLAVQ